jgi:hypothetical protein
MAAISSDNIRPRLSGWLCGLIVVLCTSWTPAHAQFIETFVSGNGNDGNNCSTVALACKSFGRALNQTFSGGQITVLDSADYGVANITGGISIVNQSGGTAVNALGGVGFGGISGMIYIDAGSTDIVTLRGLVFNGETFSGNPTFHGILINNALRVNIVDCAILNAPGAGIFVSPGVQPATLPTSINVNVQNTTVTGNGTGVKIASTVAVPVNVTIANSHIVNNAGGGFRADGGSGGPVTVAITDSTVSHNGGNGINVVSSTANVMVDLLRDVIGFNGAAGVQSNGANAAVIANSTALLNNALALSVVGSGHIVTYNNNSIVGTPGSSFTGTAMLQ